MIFELPGLLSATTAGALAKELAEAAFSDGKASAQGAARGVKHNLQLDVADPLSQRLGAVVTQALSQNEAFKIAAMPHTILPIRFCRYTEGMEYGDHLDQPIMPTPNGPLRTDLSLTVWLSDPGSYDGGELVFDSDKGLREVKGRPGDAIVYPSTTRHRVKPITRGQRLVGISWLQSMIRDAEKRMLLFKLAESAASLSERSGIDDEVMRLRQVHYNLVRMWADC